MTYFKTVIQDKLVKAQQAKFYLLEAIEGAGDPYYLQLTIYKNALAAIEELESILKLIMTAEEGSKVYNYLSRFKNPTAVMSAIGKCGPDLVYNQSTLSAETLY